MAAEQSSCHQCSMGIPRMQHFVSGRHSADVRKGSDCLAQAAEVALDRCKIGGLSGNDQSSWSSDGLVAMADTICSLEECVIENNGNVGVLSHVGSSEVTISNSTLRNNFIATGVDDSSSLTVQFCKLYANQHGAVFIGGSAQRAEVEVVNCTIEGYVWLGRKQTLSKVVFEGNSCSNQTELTSEASEVSRMSNARSGLLSFEEIASNTRTSVSPSVRLCSLQVADALDLPLDDLMAAVRTRRRVWRKRFPTANPLKRYRASSGSFGRLSRTLPLPLLPCLIELSIKVKVPRGRAGHLRAPLNLLRIVSCLQTNEAGVAEYFVAKLAAFLRAAHFGLSGLL
eukprot:748382-Hanusia_phi.AAC.1